jgi:hypothetical protein
MKNTDRLEDFIRGHREEFDYLEPSAKVWENIEANTKKGKTIKLYRYFPRIAAILVLGLIFSAILFFNRNLSSNREQAANPELQELLDTEKYYAQQVNSKLEEIRKCYTTFPEIKSDVESDLNELESMYQSLKKDLMENISNKPVIEAMIENNRYRLKLVDSVLEQINC